MSRVFDPEKDELYNACVAMFESTNEVMRVKFLREQFSELGDYRDSYEYAKKCEARLKKIDKNPFRWVTPAVIRRTIWVLVTAPLALLILYLLSNLIIPRWPDKVKLRIRVNDTYKAVEEGDFDKALDYLDEIRSLSEVSPKESEINDIVDSLYDKMVAVAKVNEQLDRAFVGCRFASLAKDLSDLSMCGLIVDKSDGKCLILLLDYDINMKYSEGDMTGWADSDLRQYLNCPFMDDELNYLISGSAVKTTVVTGDEVTEDYVFLLSAEEANEYIDIVLNRWHRNDVRWWLRDNGTNDGCMAYLDRDNNVCMEGATYDTRMTVCPAVWVEIDGGVDMYDLHEVVELLDLV